MKPFRLLWLPALLLVVVSAAGCYGSTQPVVKIGLIAPFEELYRADGYEALHAARLAVNQRNAAGGVAGRQVALVALNDNGRPEETARQAAKLAVDDDVLGVVGPLRSGGASTAGPILAGQQLAWIALAEVAPDALAGGFGLALSPEALGAAAVESLAQQPGVASVLVFTDWPDALAGAEAAGVQSGMPVRGLPLAAAAEFSPVAGEAVAWLGDAETGARLAATLGGVPVVGGAELGAAMTAGRAGEAAAGMGWLSVAPAAAEMPAGFVQAYQSLAGAPPGPRALLAYDAANLLLDAMERAAAQGELDRSAVLQALQDLGTEGWQGASGAVRWRRACAAAPACGQRTDGPYFLHPVR